MTTETDAPDTSGTPAMFTGWTRAKLAEPLNPARVAIDPRGNPYLEGWDVIAAANHDFGFDGWTSDVLSVGIAYSTPWTVGQGDRRRECEIAVYQARVAVEAGGVRRVDIGSSITADDSPQSHETAAKGAVTDALKRALRQFGAQFGNELYDKGRTGGFVEEPREPERQPEQAAAKPASSQAADVLTWAWKEHKVSRSQAFAITNVKSIEEFRALGAEAQTRIENHLAAGVGA